MDIITLQKISQTKPQPTQKQFHLWAHSVFDYFKMKGNLTIRLINKIESQALNFQYRGKDKPTNVLSFTADPIFKKTMPGFLGDLAICVPIVIIEAKAQGKTIEDHFAHLTVHGILHLLSYDHEKKSEADKMESIEIQLLEKLGIQNPYE